MVVVVAAAVNKLDCLPSSVVVDDASCVDNHGSHCEKHTAAAVPRKKEVHGVACRSIEKM